MQYPLKFCFLDSTAVYTDNEGIKKTNNRTERTASIGVAAQKLLHYGNFESGMDTWTLNNVTRGYGRKHNGYCALMGSLSYTSQVATAQKTSLTLTMGQPYTLSAYVCTADLSGFQTSSTPNDPTGVYLKVTTADQATYYSDAVCYKTDATIDRGWVRISVTFTPTVTGAATVCIVGTGATGTFFVDDIQLEEGEAPSNYNMLENGNMETSNYAWGTRENSGYSQNTGIAGTDSMRVVGHPTDIQGNFYQIVPINRAGNQSYVFSGWGKADAVTDNVTKRSNPVYDNTKQFGLRATLTYVEDTNRYYTEYYYVPFNPDVSEWQYASLTITPTRTDMTVHEITVICVYESNANTAWFDDLSLVSTTVQQMSYDSNGNPTSSTSTGLNGQTTTYDDHGNVATVSTRTGTGSSDKITYTYTYDSTFVHRMLTSSNGYTKETYSYDGVGNVTGTVLSPANNASGSKTISSSATYTNGGNHIASSTDSTGRTTNYTYRSDRCRVYGYSDEITDGSGTVTSSNLDAYGRLLTLGLIYENSFDFVSYIDYTYSRDKLETLKRVDGSDFLNGPQTYRFTYDGFGNSAAISIGDGEGSYTLASYEYGAKNGLLTKQTYGNGKTVSFTYDILGRAKTTTYSDGRVLTYTYTGDGQLYRVTDSKTGYTYTYSYDSLGRLTTSTVKDGSGTTLIHTRQVYDANNQLTGQQWTVGGTSYTQAFDYSKTEGNLTNMTLQEGDTTIGSFALSYDALQRLSQVDTGLLDRYYTYRDISSTQTTGQVSSYQYKIGSGNALYSYGYEYDQFGNISSYTENGTTYTYTYSDDSTHQLLSQTGGGKTYTYAYDGVGNIRSASDGTTTHSYTYGNAKWRDLLTAFDGEIFYYDANGNPTGYYNGTWWDMEWEEGRRLVSAATFGPTLNFTYDSDGLRLTKTVDNHNGNPTTYNYFYAGGKLMRQTDGTNTLDFFYDESGHPYALKYNGTIYYYVTNLQGDVLHIVNNAGTAVVSYTYDPYGKLLTTTGSMVSTLGAHNPLRYRGYVYDEETGFYYLQSRYYDPTTCRFINADSYASTGQGFLGYNMFAYCNNNPANMDDPAGSCSRFLGFLWKIDCKQASCPDSKNYVKPKDIASIGSYNNGQGLVYVITEDQLSIMEDKEDNVVVIIDKRTASDPNMQIQDSYRITSTLQQKEIAQLMIDYNVSHPVNPAWSRTLDSLVEEWKIHNFAYSLGYKRDRTGDCDFNNADEGKVFWDFIWR